MSLGAALWNSREAFYNGLTLARDGITSLTRENERAAALDAYRDFTGLLPDLELPPGVRYRIGCWLAFRNHCDVNSPSRRHADSAGKRTTGRACLSGVSSIAIPVNVPEARRNNW